MRVYLMESGFLARLRADRKELLILARSLGTAEEMRKARADLMASTRINLTPKADADLSKLYTIDADGTAHIPMIGELTPAAQTDICGAYTAEALTEYGFLVSAIQAADSDPRVLAIALDADTPGGYAEGVDFAAQALAGAKKPTMALVAGSMQSAGYYIGSQADKIIALSPASKVGSIGTAAEEFDDDRALAEMGIDHRVYTSSDAPEKRFDTKTEEGRAKVIEYLDGVQRSFVDRVAQGRKTTMEDVRANYGKGSTVFAPEALASRMIDEIRGMDISRETAGVAGDKTAAKADGISQTGGVKKMDLTELKNDHPALYAEATAEARTAGKAEGITEGVAQGVAQERKRLEQLNAFRGINADGDKAVDEAIKEGKAYADVAPLLSAAVAKGSGKNADGANPPDVATAAQGAGGGVPMTPELAGMAKSMGVNPADIAKFSGEKKGA